MTSPLIQITHVHFSLTRINGSGVVFRVVRTDGLPRLLPLHVVGVPLDAVLPAEGPEAVRAADQQPPRTEGDQHSDVVLAALLRKMEGF